jgi:predicted secreted protein
VLKKNISILFVTFIVATVIFVFAYSSAYAETIEANDKNNGNTIQLKVGDQINLKLESNISTGYSWNTSEKVDDKILVESSHEYSEGTQSGMVGVPGTDKWVFNAIGEGTAKLKYIYSQSWDTSTAVKTYEITIVVSGNSAKNNDNSGNSSNTSNNGDTNKANDSSSGNQNTSEKVSPTKADNEYLSAMIALLVNMLKFVF